MPSDDVHRIMKAVADRSFLGLTKQPAFGVRGLYGSIRITTGSPKEPYLPLNFVSAVPEEICDKLNLLVKEKKQRTRWLKNGSIFFSDCRFADSDPHEKVKSVVAEKRTVSLIRMKYF